MSGGRWGGDAEASGSGSGWERRERRERPTREPRQPPRLQTSMPGRPQIYVHFEFGMSFTGRNEPKPHSLTYMSRGLQQRDQRDQRPHYPRQLPPATTNYLEQPLPDGVAYPRPRAATHQTFHHPPNHASHQHQHRNPTRPALSPQDESQRHTRASSAPTYERGSSAPPPMNDSPWDAEPEPVGFSALPRSEAHRPRRMRNPPTAQRDEEPRFGNDGMPLTANSWHGEAWAEAETGESSSTSARRRLDVPDHGQARDLAALSSAMMTVDNGFEDQWWFQGQRETHTTDDPAPPRRNNNMPQSRSMPTSPRTPQDYSTMSSGAYTMDWDDVVAEEKDETTRPPVRTSSLAYRHERLGEEWEHHTRQFSVPTSAASTFAHASAALPARPDAVSPITEAGSPPPPPPPSSAYAATQQRSDSAELFYYR